MIIPPAPFDPLCTPVLYQGLMEDVLPTLPEHSVDLILTDPPYGIQVQHAWDKQPALSSLWNTLHRVLAHNGVMVVTAIQPFTTALIATNPQMF